MTTSRSPIASVRGLAHSIGASAAVGAIVLGLALPARAERIENPTAVFAALDKVTARIQKLATDLGQTKEFGSLLVTPRVCYSRPPTEPPKTSAFVEVEEVKLDGTKERIFAGWMFAESPGLNAIEHPVFDIWLTGCEGVEATVAAKQSGDADGDAAAAEGETTDEGQPKKRRRVKRQ